MTKVTILGAETQEEKSLKKIEFKKFLGSDLIIENIKPHHYLPKNYKNIELIGESVYMGYDLMYAYMDDRNDKKFACIFLGHFNDGVV